jgi:hypothetical protein
VTNDLVVSRELIFISELKRANDEINKYLFFLSFLFKKKNEILEGRELI